MNNEKFKKCIIETIVCLKKIARRAKEDVDNSKEGFKDYVLGVIMGYYSIIMLLKHQAFVFCIDQKEIGLADIKPDIDLLGLERSPEAGFEEDNWTNDAVNEERVKDYLSDSITLLKEQAKEAKKDAYNPKKGSEEYNKGSMKAYCSVFFLLKKQARLFNVDEKELGLADIDLERDLI